jgi:hypothetical protein
MRPFLWRIGIVVLNKIFTCANKRNRSMQNKIRTSYLIFLAEYS